MLGRFCAGGAEVVTMPMPIPDRVVVINLRRRPDRLASFRRAWAASEWEKLLGDPLVFAGIDGHSTRVPTEMWNQAGAYGCWRSHVEVLAEALDEGAATVAVFEDDAIPAPQSAGRLARALRGLPASAAGLWLDGELLGPDNWAMHGPFGTQRLLRPPLRTHGYILRRDLMEGLWEVLQRRPGHVDHLFATSRVDVPIFAASPSLVTQSGSPSDTGSQWTLPERGHPVQRSKRSR